jgi:hypothetical protein
MRNAAIAALLVTTACSDPLPPGEPARLLDLAAATGQPELALTGVAVEAETGRRFVLDTNLGIWELDAAGAATHIMPMAALPDPGVEIRWPLTDFTALGDSRLALTAIGDGFILDLAANTLQLHFCYEPGFVEPWPEEIEQRTDAVTFDPGADRIIAQPRTFVVESGEVTASQIGYYDRESGVDLQWYDVPIGFESGGMAVAGDLGLVVSNGTSLLTFDGGLDGLDELERFGVKSIDGLAYDPTAGTLLVLDGASRQLVEIAAADLGL